MQSLSLQTTLALLPLDDFFLLIGHSVSATQSWNTDISSHTTVCKFSGCSFRSIHSVPFCFIPLQVLLIPFQECIIWILGVLFSYLHFSGTWLVYAVHQTLSNMCVCPRMVEEHAVSTENRIKFWICPSQVLLLSQWLLVALLVQHPGESYACLTDNFLVTYHAQCVHRRGIGFSFGIRHSIFQFPLQ